ncbi:prolyl oligopeptidase family serine peptidase [uncultured Chryseobacterium sp.]|uniref:alpha/beta hydrolase family protein n=1 Tax=uncultured Chryseobacterium sp. TaxID=259322 RepID=UPI00258E50D9|nr:prolyl oligopeptidase family serine peptidase [uncultured Chryseobacterium sp.]
MKKILIFLLILLNIIGNGQSKVTYDTLQQWISRYHTINNLTYSPDTNFVAMRKIYSTNSDTAVVLEANRTNNQLATILKMPNNMFLKNSSLFSYGNGIAQHSNLHKKSTVKYENVRFADILFELNQYLIMDKSGTLKLYGSANELLQSVANSQMFTTDKKNLLFLNFKEGTINKVARIDSDKKVILFETQKEITQMLLPPSGKDLILCITDPKTRKLQLVFIDTQYGKQIILSGIEPQKADFVEVSPVKDGKAYFITFASRRKPSKENFLDIWYGRDNNLGAKQAGSTDYLYYLWSKDTNRTYQLPNTYPIYSNIDSERYVLAFNPLEEFKNLTLHPFLNLKLYDTLRGTFTEIFHQVTKDIVHSSDGRFIIALNPKDQKWNLYEVEIDRHIIIDNQSLQNPTFSEDFKNILFESSNDVYIFDIKSQTLFPAGISKEQEARILNAERRTTNPVFGFKMNMFSSKRPLLIRTVNKISNSSTYSSFYKAKIKTVIPTTKNRIKDIKYDQDLKNLVTIEENYNMAPKIFSSKAGSKKKIEIFTTKDKTGQTLKQEIIQYKNSLGIPLKGVLYYPTGYDQSKKYPMVVYIYQIKSTLSNFYSLPANEPTGVNRRTLLEHGYFVYEPDIVFDGGGPGLAALDCINSALDALSTYTAINKNKIGLTGHSLGGYETNFIATHSDRFAAFITGAGYSDITSRYFSYDYHEQKPNHTRFETGQYEMNKPFSEDKQLYLKNSPINYVEMVKAPVLIWNGVKDDIVPAEQAMEFFMGLKRNNLPTIALFYQQREHDLGWNTKESMDMNRRSLEWWDYFLKNKTNIPWIEKEIKRDAT